MSPFCHRHSESKCPLAVLPVIVFVMASVSVKAQNSLDECRRLWAQRHYAEAADRLQEYRNQTRDRSLEVDYMIATSFCRLPDTRGYGYELLRRIGQRQAVSPRNREILSRETSKCSVSNASVPPAPQALVLATAVAQSSVRGKGGYYLDLEGTEIEGNDSTSNKPVEKLRDFTMEELRRRVFDRSKASEAIALINGLVGKQFRVVRQGRFIFATSSGQTTPELGEISENLERYISFYETQYHLNLPDKLITLYLVPEDYNLSNLARQIHGLEIGHDTIGYSLYEDLSIAAVIPRTVYGTLSHELFHLMVRQKFGDIPPWLEEGMASAYAVATRRGTQIYALPNWRGAVLRKFLDRRLTIEQLITADWSLFETQREYERTEVEHKATAYALANYFVLYLQEQGKLQAVFKAFYDQDIANLTRDGRLVDARVLESILGKPLREVDSSFNSWFLSVNRRPVSPY